MPHFLRLLMVAGALLPSVVFADSTTTHITATIVASSCQGAISTNGQRGTSGMIDFGVINPKLRAAPVENFSLILSEYTGGEIGCSAFDAYAQTHAFATLIFGDLSNQQLDDQGIVTRYEDGSASPIRVRVYPTNAEARFTRESGPGFVTQGDNILLYPVDFAARGQFDFQAKLANTEEAKAGKFTGTLSLTMVYR